MVWIFAVAEIVEGEQKGKMNPEISLPAEAAGWTWDGKEMKYNSKTLFDYIDGAAELYLAYGFQSLRVRRFEKSNQPPITVELYEMASSEDAYGVFSFERQDEAVGIGQGSEFGGGLLRFWKGKYFVSIYADGEGAEVESAILTMGRATADSIQGTGPEPKLVDFIPGKDLGLVDQECSLSQEPCSPEPAVLHSPPEYLKPEPEHGSCARPIHSRKTENPPAPHSISQREGGKRCLSELHGRLPS